MRPGSPPWRAPRPRNEAASLRPARALGWRRWGCQGRSPGPSRWSPGSQGYWDRPGGQLVQRGVDLAQAVAGDLVGDRDQPGELRRRAGRPADDEPAAGAAPGGVDQRAGPRAGLERDVGDAAHRADRGGPGRQAVLVRRRSEDVAEAAARIDPADLPVRLVLAVGRRVEIGR